MNTVESSGSGFGQLQLVRQSNRFLRLTVDEDEDDDVLALTGAPFLSPPPFRILSVQELAAYCTLHHSRLRSSWLHLDSAALFLSMRSSPRMAVAVAVAVAPMAPFRPLQL